MKRVLEWAFWAIGAVAMAYLALYLYASLTGRQFEPGDPIHIFRSPDAGLLVTVSRAGRGGLQPACADVAADSIKAPAGFKDLECRNISTYYSHRDE